MFASMFILIKTWGFVAGKRCSFLLKSKQRFSVSRMGSETKTPDSQSQPQSSSESKKSFSTKEAPCFGRCNSDMGSE